MNFSKSLILSFLRNRHWKWKCFLPQIFDTQSLFNEKWKQKRTHKTKNFFCVSTPSCRSPLFDVFHNISSYIFYYYTQTHIIMSYSFTKILSISMFFFRTRHRHIHQNQEWETLELKYAFTLMILVIYDVFEAWAWGRRIACVFLLLIFTKNKVFI